MSEYAGEQQPEINARRHQPRRESGLVGLRVGIARADDPLQRIVEPFGNDRQPDPDVGDQAGALRRDRCTDLRSASHPLHEHLRLLALENLLPCVRSGIRFQ